MTHRDDMRRALEELDVKTARGLWARVAPGLPQPPTDEHALATLHHARTRAESIRFRKRAYSHSWLRERGLPSGLPDDLRPRAEQMHPVTVGVVGLATANTTNTPERRELGRLILGAMSDRVAELYSEGETRPEIVKPEIMLRRAQTYRRLLGSLTAPPIGVKL